jgi:predicted nucleic acid-binding protein
VERRDSSRDRAHHAPDPSGPTHPERFAEIPDPDDRKFAALAQAAGPVLISNDRHLLNHRDRMELTVLTPSEFWQRQQRSREPPMEVRP